MNLISIAIVLFFNLTMFSLLSKCRTMPKSSAPASKLVVQARHLPYFAPYSSQMIYANDRLFLSSYILCNPGWSLLSMNEWSGPCPKYVLVHVSMKTRQPTKTRPRHDHYHLLLSGLIIHNVKTPMNDMPLNLNPKRIRPMDTTPTRHQLRSGPVRKWSKLVHHDAVQSKCHSAR